MSMLRIERVKGDLERALKLQKDAVLLMRNLTERKSLQSLRVCTSKFWERKKTWRKLFNKKSGKTESNNNYDYNVKANQRINRRNSELWSYVRIAALEAELLKAEAVRREMLNRSKNCEGTSACFVEFGRHRVKLRRLQRPLPWNSTWCATVHYD